MVRDLQKDLEICEKAPSGPWEVVKCGKVDGREVCWIKGTILEEYLTVEEADFITEAREGWPEAIQRAITAEANKNELIEALETVFKLLREFDPYWYNKEYDNTLKDALSKAKGEVK